MNKVKLMVGVLSIFISASSMAGDPIPDPTVQMVNTPAMPPAGLPGTPLNSINSVVAPTIAPVFINELNLQGVFISTPKDNKVFINNNFYKTGDIISDTWKVKSIARNKVTLTNIQTKQIKNLNISGE